MEIKEIRSRDQDVKGLITRDTNIITEHEAASGSHYTGKDDDGSDLGLELHTRWRHGGESTRRHDHETLKLLTVGKKKKDYVIVKQNGEGNGEVNVE